MMDTEKSKKLLLHLHPRILPLGYPKEHIAKYPFTQMVNRVDENFNGPFRVKSILRNPTKINLSSVPELDMCCYSSAAALSSGFGPIYVKWSGGTDSTLALLSLFHFGSKETRERLHIICSWQSLKEFPELYPFIKQNFKGKVHSSLEPIKPLLEKGTIVTGEFGDQLFGSSMMEKMVGVNGDTSDLFERPYGLRLVVNFLKSVTGATEEQVVFLINEFETTYKACPIRIKNMFDFLWWFNFTMKGQHVILRDMALEKFEPAMYMDNYRSFFYTSNFEAWSMTNHHKKLGNTWNTYKLPAKQLITRLSGISEQEERVKGSSRPNILRNWASPFNIAIDEDYKYIKTFVEEQKYLNTWSRN